MNLLIDVGNSRLKWALAREALVESLPAIDHADAAWLDDVERVARTLAPPDAVWIAAVASGARIDALRARLAMLWPGVPQHGVTTARECLGVRVAYADPPRLGVDRFLALLGGRARDSGPLLVASLGTALAIDALATDGEHLGGLIAPSPQLMRASVLERTARVGWQTDGVVVAFGRTSEDGLESGCWLAAAALVERSIDEVVARCGTCTALLAGGGAVRLQPLVRRAALRVDDLVLEGLARYAAKK